MYFHVGLAWDLVGTAESLMQSTHNRLTLSVDGNHPSDAPEYAAVGMEYTIHNMITLRSGYRLNRDVEKLFYGIGLNIPLLGSVFAIDYALASFGELDYIEVVSGSIAFAR